MFSLYAARRVGVGTSVFGGRYTDGGVYPLPVVADPPRTRSCACASIAQPLLQRHDHNVYTVTPRQQAAGKKKKNGTLSRLHNGGLLYQLPCSLSACPCPCCSFALPSLPPPVQPKINQHKKTIRRILNEAQLKLPFTVLHAAPQLPHNNAAGRALAPRLSTQERRYFIYFVRLQLAGASLLNAIPTLSQGAVSRLGA